MSPSRTKDAYLESPCVEWILFRRGLGVRALLFCRCCLEDGMRVGWHSGHGLDIRDGRVEEIQVVCLILGLDGVEAQSGC